MIAKDKDFLSATVTGLRLRKNETARARNLPDSDEKNDTAEPKKTAKQVKVSPVTIPTLRALVIFDTLDDKRLEALLPSCRLLSMPKNHVLMRAGEDTDNIYLLLSGQLRVMLTENGRETALSTLLPGEVFGEMGVLDDQPRSATIEASESSAVVVINKADFQQCIAENFDVSLFIIRGLIRRLRDADRRITSLALYDVSGRVARCLLEHQKRKGAVLRLSLVDIALEVGASREMVFRVTRSFEDRGLVRIDKRSITILKEDLAS